MKLSVTDLKDKTLSVHHKLTRQVLSLHVSLVIKSKILTIGLTLVKSQTVEQKGLQTFTLHHSPLLRGSISLKCRDLPHLSSVGVGGVFPLRKVVDA